MSNHQIESNAGQASSLPVHRALSGHYLAIAKVFAEQAEQIEEQFYNSKRALKEGKLDNEYLGYVLHSIISSVMALEAYTNEQMYLSNPNGLPRCPHKHAEPSIEKKICAVFRYHDPTAPPFELSKNVQNIIFARNQYVHYDFEGISGDLILNPITESEKRLDDVLFYFEPLFKNGTLKRNPLYPSMPLFPLGFLSSDFARWCLVEILREIKRISVNSSALTPAMTRNLFKVFGV